MRPLCHSKSKAVGDPLIFGSLTPATACERGEVKLRNRRGYDLSRPIVTRGVNRIFSIFSIGNKGVPDVKLIDREELKEKLDSGDDFRLVMALGEWAYRAKH